MADKRRLPISSRLGAMAAGLRRWWADQDSVRDLVEVDATERRRLLGDLHISERDLLAATSSGAKVDRLLPRMLDALGLDRERLGRDHPQLDQDLARVCSQCTDTRRCRRELTASTAGDNFGQFCPNAATLSELVAALPAGTEKPRAAADAAESRSVPAADGTVR